MSNFRKRFIKISGMLWGIVMALSVNTGSLTNAVDFTIPTTLSFNKATLNMPGSITVASSGTVQFDSTNHGVNGDSTFIILYVLRWTMTWP